MKIFDKRPLSFILCIWLCSFVFFSFSVNAIRILLIFAIPILLFVAFLVKTIEKKTKILLIIISSVLCISVLFSYIYFDLWFNAHDRFEGEAEIYGTVESVSFESASKTLILKSETINEKNFSSYRLLVELDDDKITNISKGSKIKFTGILTDFKDTTDFDSNIYYKSRGVSSFVRDVSDIVLLGYDEPGIKSKLADYRASISRYLVLHSDAESGGLLSALLIGERTYLSGQIRLDFSRIGISHILALSGMHLSMLCLGLSWLLYLFGINKRIRKLLEILFALIYMSLIGFPVSVVRAGVMYIISALLFFFSKSKDSVTNLIIAVTVIIIINPYSIFDISLWLSAFATLGVIICAELFEKLKKPDKNKALRLIYPIIVSLTSSLFAVVATIPFTFISFNSFSVFSVFATLIFSPMILVFMYFGTLFLAVCSFIPLGGILAFFKNILAVTAAFFSSGRYSTVSADSIICRALALVTVSLLFLFIVLDIKHKKISVAVIAACFILTNTVGLISSISKNNSFDFEYVSHNQNEKILVKSEGSCSLISLSNQTSSDAYLSASYLKDKGIYSLDSYIITHYSVRTIAGCTALLNTLNIDKIYLPYPQDSFQEDVHRELSRLNETYHLEIITYKTNEIIKEGDFAIVPTYYDTENRLALTVYYNDGFYSYLSADMFDKISLTNAFSIMNGANTVIVGARGASESNSSFIYKVGGETKILYNNNKKGLSTEILDYYQDRISVVAPEKAIDLYVE